MPEQHITVQRQEIELRSEEVQELLGRIPPWIIRWGITVVFFTLVLLLAGSWYVQYPDVLVSSLVVTTTHPPAAIVARGDGNIEQLFVHDYQPVTRGEVLACLGTTALYDDVMELKRHLDAFESRFRSDTASAAFTVLRDDLNVGTLQAGYANLLSVFHAYQHGMTLQSHQKKVEAIEAQIQQHRMLATRSLRQKQLLQQELDLSQRQYERYQHLHQQALVSQHDLDALQGTVLQNTYAVEEMDAEADNIALQIARLEASQLDITLQYQEQQQAQHLAFRTAYDQLRSQLASWEQANLLIAPINGTVTFTDYWSAHQNVRAGDVVMTVVPDEASHLLGKVRLPVQGAGKVEPGQRVLVKFANYPYREYGMVAGRVEHISLVPVDAQYVVEVSFPDGLTTTHGKRLPFTQEMPGTAEIITEPRRLLERLIHPVQALFDHYGTERKP